MEYTKTMDKKQLLGYLDQYVQSDESAHFRPSETKDIFISDIPEDIGIEISELDEKGIRHIELEGSFKKQNGKLYLHMAHDWYRKWWTAPLGLAHHMDLIKRLVEFRQREEQNIEGIEFDDEGDWCHLYYSIIIPDKIKTLYDAYDFGIDFSIWKDRILHSVQKSRKRGQVRFWLLSGYPASHFPGRHENTDAGFSLLSRRQVY